MSDKMLEVSGLRVEAGGKEILHGIDLLVKPGETHVLMGPNGAGKSTLGNALMGHPLYKTVGGSIFFCGSDVTALSADRRAKAGLFLSFQNPIEVPGVTLANFLRSALGKVSEKRLSLVEFRKRLRAEMDVLQMAPAYANRDLNVGFSGGEKKKAEILSLLMLQPKLAILDETDSGLDVDAVRTVSEGVREFKKEPGRSLLIITHSTRILEALKVDRTHVLVDGRIVVSGGPELVDEINERGFEKYEGVRQ